LRRSIWVSANLLAALLFLSFTATSVLSNQDRSVSPGDRVPRAMSKASQQQDVSVLSAAKNGLVYLTPNDWALIADKAVRKQFKTGEAIVSKGKRTYGVYLLLKGAASVEIPKQGTALGINPGEACGEISFLDELPATANVIAQGDVEAYYLDRPTLQSMFELFPHLGSRFYHSLAAILSRRLRELIGPAAEQKTTTSK
jgi:signal-transduction protein with cAMP-binding, CBS, and nucleotidyltransferase domain